MRLGKIVNTITSCPKNANYWKLLYSKLTVLLINQKQVKVTINGAKSCEICLKITPKNSYLSKLSCGHFICNICIIKQIDKATGGLFNELYDRTQCPICNKKIPSQELLTCVDYREIVKLNEEAMKRVCAAPICCQCKKSMQNMIILKCNHQYCEDCLRGNINNSLPKGYTPNCASECKKDLSSSIIALYQPATESSDKILNISLKIHRANQLLRVDQKETVDILTSCSNCKSHYSTYSQPNNNRCCARDCIITDTQKKSILYIMCVLCMRNAHIGKTCQEAANEDPEILQLLKSNPELRKCPYCNILISRTKGCNMMVCISPSCQNKKSFCYVCNQKVEPFDDYTHFGSNKYKNCFGQYCKNFPDPSGNVTYDGQH